VSALSPCACYLDTTHVTSRIGGTVLLFQQAKSAVLRNAIPLNRTDYSIACTDTPASSSLLWIFCSNPLCTIFLTLSMRSRHDARAARAVSRRLVALGHEICLPITAPASYVVSLGSWCTFLFWHLQTVVANSQPRRVTPVQIGRSWPFRGTIFVFMRGDDPSLRIRPLAAAGLDCVCRVCVLGSGSGPKWH
jgi:hypothetical protein